MVDVLKNFAKSAIVTAPSPATSGTSCTVTAGTGTLFSVGYAIVWPSGTPAVGTAEIVRITAIATDTLTITRTQETTSAISIATGYLIQQGVTAGLLAEIVAALGITATSPDSSVTIGGTAIAPTFEVNGTAIIVTLFGSGVPSSGLGANGDYYGDIGTAGTINVYGPKTSGAWGSIINTISGGGGGGGTTAGRTASASVAAGENTVFTGSTASQTLTLPTSSSIPPNTITNNASVTVTVAPGAGQTLNNLGTVGSIVLPTNTAVSLVLVGTVWYVINGSYIPNGPFACNGLTVNGGVKVVAQGIGNNANEAYVNGTYSSGPPNSSAVATALGATLALGTSFHNTLGYDIIMNVALNVTANTSLVVSLGVGSATGPTQNTIETGDTSLGVRRITFKIPAGYYALLSVSGTQTSALVGQFVQAA